MAGTANAAVISLLTDFGLADPFVGLVHGVIASIAPHARVIDLCHGIPPQAIDLAGFVLGSAVPYFPTGTIHVAVVDPTVGTERAIVAAEANGQIFLAPDNGLLTVLHDRLGGFVKQVAVTNESYWLPRTSRTFHGRDIFAPVAAHLANGTPLSALGPMLPAIVRRPFPVVETLPDGLRGVVFYVDRYGNLVTNIPADAARQLAARGPLVIRTGRIELRELSPSYASVPVGHCVALVNSFNLLEIAVREGSAAQAIGLGVGAEVVIALDFP